MSRRRRNRWVQAFDKKRVITRYGVVEMPTHLDPETVTIEQLLSDRAFKVVPKSEITEAVQKLLDTLSIEALPELHPKPDLTHHQVCMLEIIAELEVQDQCDWGNVLYHYGIIKSEGRYNVGKIVGDALIRRQLVTADGPMLTLQGRSRVQAEEEAQLWRDRLGLTEYLLERVEQNPDPDYDEIYFIKDGRLDCYFRHECFEVQSKIVVLASYVAP
jgi:hypothetical protein